MRYPAVHQLAPGQQRPSLRQAATAIRQALLEHARTGLLLDFDGTLAPIVREPERAHTTTDVRAALAALAKRLRVVGVVSGRELDDLAVRAATPGIWLVGSHGAVIRQPNGSEVRAYLSPVLVDQLARLTVDLSDLSGIRQEFKASAIAFHYRGLESNPALVEELRRRVRAAAQTAGLTTGEGRCVIEARVPGIDKGTAVNRIMETAELDVVVVVGDDWTDLDAFGAVHSHQTCEGIAIAVQSDEMPGPLGEEADVLAESVADVQRWLSTLI